jgi:hypothetical protein
MKTFIVRLRRILNGATVGSTEDRIEAEDALTAEAEAIEAWSMADPSCTYAPLLTTEVSGN